MIKATPELLAALGAENQAGVIPAILGKIEAVDAKLKNADAQLDERFSSFASAESVAELKGEITNLTEAVAKIQPVDIEAIIAKAKEAASLQAATALGTVGVNPVAAAPSAEPTAVDTVANFVARGDYEAAWNASKEIQAEFSSAKSYAAYEKAVSQGKVKILNQKH